ncbi:MAG: PilZ domain-containing protein [Candidatus Omnitrophica bacterium]|nr:PilZ domain-containing protein [Candidatus Omnitrophota bacterium]
MLAREKRRNPRLRVHLPLRYQIRGTPEYSNSLCEDISLGGLSFINDKFIAPSTPLKLEINVLSRILSPQARIAWAAPLAHSDRYRMGVEFLEISPQEKNYLSDYLDIHTTKV